MDEITEFLADYPQAVAAQARRLHELVLAARIASMSRGEQQLLALARS